MGHHGCLAFYLEYVEISCKSARQNVMYWQYDIKNMHLYHEYIERRGFVESALYNSWQEGQGNAQGFEWDTVNGDRKSIQLMKIDCHIFGDDLSCTSYTIFSHLM